MVDHFCFMIYCFLLQLQCFSCATVFIVCFELFSEFIFICVYRLCTSFLVFYTSYNNRYLSCLMLKPLGRASPSEASHSVCDAIIAGRKGRCHVDLIALFLILSSEQPQSLLLGVQPSSSLFFWNQTSFATIWSKTGEIDSP